MLTIDPLRLGDGVSSKGLSQSGERRSRGHTSGAASPTLVAAFACSETDRIGRQIGFSVLVLAATTDPTAHARLLSETWHAAWTACEGWFQPFDYGLVIPQEVAYVQRPFDPRWVGDATLPGPVSLRDGCLLVELPPDASKSEFAATFALAMADRQFDRVARRPASVARRFATGLPLAVPPRYAMASAGVFGRVRLVEDLYAFRPRDLPAVARAAAMAANGLAVRSLLVSANVAGSTYG